MLEELCVQLGVRDKVFFAGWISDGMDGYYASIDINAISSLSETFPYAVTCLLYTSPSPRDTR